MITKLQLAILFVCWNEPQGATGFVPLCSGYNFPSITTPNNSFRSRVFWLSSTNTNDNTKRTRKHRFNVAAPSDTRIEQDCLLKIHGKLYDLQAFAKAHPGGSAVLKRFHNKDATAAFEMADHSNKARQLLATYEVQEDEIMEESITAISVPVTGNESKGEKRPWKKLFTQEDPIGYHKYLGIFCLLHFVWRHVQIFSTSSVTAGFGLISITGSTRTNPWVCLWLLPHALLNASAFIFHSVPRERIVGSPMIWEEYRVHNLIFVLRSIVCTILCHLSIAKGHQSPWRKLALVGSVASVLASNYAADITTNHLQPAKNDSSIASLPFWDGCTLQSQRRIKKFYAYCQFMATIACFMVCNPAWPFVVMMPIQFSSILLTLVRKSVVGAKGWHVAYLASLMFPFLVGSQHFLTTMALDVPIALVTGSALFGLRCRGVSKYCLWGFAGALRILYGDRILRYDIW